MKQEQERVRQEEERKQRELDAEKQRLIENERKAEEEKESLEKMKRELEQLKLEAEQRAAAEYQRLAAEKAQFEAAKKEEQERIAKLVEEERKREEAKQKQEEEEKKKQDEIKIAKITIYTRKLQEEKGNEQEPIVKEITKLFIDNGFKQEDIFVSDVSHDMELASFLKEICKNTESYPLVCAGNLPIGTVEHVRKLVSDSEKLQSLHNGTYQPDFLTQDQADSLREGTGTVGRGVLDHGLDAVEYVISSVGSLLWLPVNIVTYPFRSAKEELKKETDDLDFEIVHTNWYWRNLRRTFRFTKDSILRIHPSHNDVRASHRYDTIMSISVVDENNMIITYEDKSSPDYIKSTPQDLEQMVKIITERSNAMGHKPLMLDVSNDLSN